MPLFRPEFFDIFGIAVFGFVIVASIWALKTKKALPKLILTILLMIGIIGLIVDSVMVYTVYMR